MAPAKVEPMKKVKVVGLVRRHLEGIVAWTQTHLKLNRACFYSL
jgi:hypothetical protein